MSSSLFQRSLKRNGKPITLQNRDIVSPEFNGFDFDESFSGDTDVLAKIKTVRGKTFFDGTGTEFHITHEIRIEYVDGITSESWVLFKNRRFDVLEVENCCENDDVLVLVCTERGKGEAAKA